MKGRGVVVSAEVSAQFHPQGTPFLAVLIFVQDERGLRVGLDGRHFYGDIEACVAATAHLFTRKERDGGMTLGGLVGREVEFEYGPYLLGFKLASLRSVGIPSDGGRS